MEGESPTLMKGQAGLLNESSLNTLTFQLPLSGISCMKLPVELKSPKKGLINIKKHNQKCFLWCHIRHINMAEIHLERITRKGKKLVNNLNYDRIEFPAREKDFSKIEKKKNFCINVFCYENKLTFPIYV